MLGGNTQTAKYAVEICKEDLDGGVTLHRRGGGGGGPGGGH